MSLVLKGRRVRQRLTVGGHVPREGSGGRKWRLRNGRRYLNRVATGMGCCVFVSKPRDATSAKERLL